MAGGGEQFGPDRVSHHGPYLGTNELGGGVVRRLVEGQIVEAGHECGAAAGPALFVGGEALWFGCFDGGPVIRIGQHAVAAGAGLGAFGRIHGLP